jgi:hypothetical protein
MMGTRSGHKDDNQHILYSTREDIRAKKRAARAAAALTEAARKTET